MTQSLCETCAWMREIVTPKGSRFLLFQLSKSDPAYPKYPPQPMVRCDGHARGNADSAEKDRNGE